MNWRGVKNVDTKWIPEVITNQIIVGLTGNVEQQDKAWEFLSSDVCQMLIDYRFDGGAVDG